MRLGRRRANRFTLDDIPTSTDDGQQIAVSTSTRRSIAHIEIGLFVYGKRHDLPGERVLGNRERVGPCDRNEGKPTDGNHLVLSGAVHEDRDLWHPRQSASLLWISEWVVTRESPNKSPWRRAPPGRGLSDVRRRPSRAGCGAARSRRRRWLSHKQAAASLLRLRAPWRTHNKRERGSPSRASPAASPNNLLGKLP
jgi:hypothetical protein